MRLVRTLLLTPAIAVAASLPLGAADDEEAGAATPAEGAGAVADWSVPVPGWTAPLADEHPRLIFRKSEIARLRERAKSAEGAVIMKRLDGLLQGKLTTWHPAGWAFRYVVTGDAADAAKAKECAEQLMGGAANPDPRYHFAKPNGQLRAGATNAALAFAYDMAFDGWDPAFRQRVATTIQDYPMLAEIVRSPRHGPGCNHFGAHQGGSAVALLGIRGDSGVDSARADQWLEKLVAGVRREIAHGYGERGYYYEGHQCGRISGNTGVIPFLIAYRNAAGRDLVSPRSNARWIAGRMIWEFTRSAKGYQDLERGMYARNFPRGTQLSENGDFAQGFAIVAPEHRAELLWTYNHMIQPGTPAERDYDVTQYPLHAAFALAHWPIGEQERDPDEKLAKVFHDPGPNYLIFRNGWTGGEEDVIVTALLGSRPKSGRGMAQGGSVRVAGKGLVYDFPGMFHSSRMTHHRFAVDGSGTVSGMVITDGPLDAKKAGPLKKLAPKPTALAVDFSKASGAELVVVQAGPQVGHQVAYWMDISPIKGAKDASGSGGWKTTTTMLQLGGQPCAVMVLAKEAPPKPAAQGDTLTVGGQSFRFDGEKLEMKTMAAELVLDPAK